MLKTNQIDLWSPIADAWEAYRQRVSLDRKTQRAVYEHIWRLIHIEEALVVTLGAALASRLRNMWDGDQARLADLNKLRIMITGRQSPDGPQGDDRKGEWCLKGSIGAWTDLLTWFSRTGDGINCPFCATVLAYLRTSVPDPIAFLSAWRGVAPVSETFNNVRDRVGRLQAINSFRNKIAHVPISGTRFSEIFRGLRREVILLLTEDDRLLSSDPWSEMTTGKWHNALRGILADGASYRTGLKWGTTDRDGDDALFGWGNPADIEGTVSTWDASPFVRFNEELKALICFRVNGLELDDEAYSADFHRFAAEIEPVQERTIMRALLKPWFPVAPSAEGGNGTDLSTGPEPPLADPVVSAAVIEALPDKQTITDVQITPIASEEAPTPAELRAAGEEAYRARRYMEAVKAFDELRESSDVFWYNDVAKYKHGSALWRAAEHNMKGEGEILTGLQEAIELLESATCHRDLDWRSKAYYQLSKARWHLWKHRRGDLDLIWRALQDAKTAADLVYDPAYMSWHDRLQSDVAEISTEATVKYP